NEGFSGGEKKRNEILQLLMLEPKMAILDETDSGLDIDALKVVARGVNALRGPEFGALVITHYQRILHHLKPDVVHVMMNDRIVRSGGPDLAEELDARGSEWLRQEVGTYPWPMSAPWWPSPASRGLPCRRFGGSPAGCG